MLIIRKRNGTTETFDAEKIKNSLAAASDEVGQPLASGALSGILRELEGLLEDKQQVSSRQVYLMVVGILCDRGYQDILREYIRHSDNAFNQ